MPRSCITCLAWMCRAGGTGTSARCAPRWQGSAEGANAGILCQVSGAGVQAAGAGH